MTIQLTFTPDHLDTAIACTSRFRDRSGYLPTLAAVHVRFEPDSDRTRVQFTATDSYHLVRLSVPVEQVKDPQSWLSRRGGVVIDLPVGDTRRALAAMRQVERDRIKAEREAKRAHARRVFGKGPTTPFKGGAPTLAQLTIANGAAVDGATTRFSLDDRGSWTGGGCYVSAVGERADRVSRFAGGARLHADYPNADALIAKTADETDNGNLRVAYNPELLGDICSAAAAFHNGPLIVDKVARLNPTLFTMDRPTDKCTFLGLIMPVRVS